MVFGAGGRNGPIEVSPVERALEVGGEAAENLSLAERTVLERILKIRSAGLCKDVLVIRLLFWDEFYVEDFVAQKLMNINI